MGSPGGRARRHAAARGRLGGLGPGSASFSDRRTPAGLQLVRHDTTPGGLSAHTRGAATLLTVVPSGLPSRGVTATAGTQSAEREIRVVGVVGFADDLGPRRPPDAAQVIGVARGPRADVAHGETELRRRHSAAHRAAPDFHGHARVQDSASTSMITACSGARAGTRSPARITLPLRVVPDQPPRSSEAPHQAGDSCGPSRPSGDNR